MQAMTTELQDILGKVISDLGGTANAALVIVGDQLGLYRALAEIGPSTPLRTCRTHRHARALHSRMARGAG